MMNNSEALYCQIENIKRNDVHDCRLVNVHTDFQYMGMLIKQSLLKTCKARQLYLYICALQN